MDPLVEFEFQNLDYGLINEAKNEVYVNIDRECRTVPFVGMKQPTPIGGMLGCEAVLKLQHKGKIAAKYRWELYISDQLLQSGVTDINGRSGDFPIPLAYGNPMTYKIKIFPPKEKEKKDETPEPTTDPEMGKPVPA